MSTLRVDNLQGQTAGTNRYVVQVVQGTISSTSTTSTSFTTTGLTATITPQSTNNKILVSVKGIGSADADNSNQALFRMVRSQPSADTIVDGQDNFPYNSNQFGQGFATVEGQRERYPVMCDLLDSPSTTSAVTYAIYWRVGHGSGTVYYNNYASGANRTRSWFTVEEIAQ